MKYFMSFYRFESPSAWIGARDIDEEIDIEKITAEMNFGNEEEDSQQEEEMTAKKSKEKGDSKKNKKEKKK